MLLNNVSLINDLQLKSLGILEASDSVILVVLFGYDQYFCDIYSDFQLDSFHIVLTESRSLLVEVTEYFGGLDTLTQKLFSDNLGHHGFRHLHLLQLCAEHFFNLLDGYCSGFDVEGGLGFVSKSEQTVIDNEHVL